MPDQRGASKPTTAPQRRNTRCVFAVVTTAHYTTPFRMSSYDSVQAYDAVTSAVYGVTVLTALYRLVRVHGCRPITSKKRMLLLLTVLFCIARGGSFVWGSFQESEATAAPVQITLGRLGTCLCFTVTTFIATHW